MRMRKRKVRDGVKRFAVQRPLVPASPLKYALMLSDEVRIYTHFKGHKLILLQAPLAQILQELKEAHDTIAEQVPLMLLRERKMKAVSEFEEIVKSWE